MSQLLIAHSDDLKRLQDEGYSITVRGNHLVVADVPYVNSSKQICYGTLVSELSLVDDVTTAKPSTHVIHFSGEHPCDKSGKRIEPIINASNRQEVAPGLMIDHTFSNKPPEGYCDYYHKVSTYAGIISAYAKSIDPSVTEKPFVVITADEEDSVFNYRDTNSSRASIMSLSEKFRGQKIGIIGLGGTGSYILDFVSKTPVSEIHLYDGDALLQHNAFRSPGTISQETLSQKRSKVEHHKFTYSVLHKGIVAHPYMVDESNIGELLTMSFVFVSIDNDRSRKLITDYLSAHSIPFIDVGLGVDAINGKLTGILRVTTATPIKNDHLEKRIPVNNDAENEYRTNIQIAELNAMNACFAVVKWKKSIGFYHDQEGEHFTLYTLNNSQLNNEDSAA